MQFNRKYRITVEDESSLQKKINFSSPLSLLLLILMAIMLIAGTMGMVILALTPMRNHLPGYLKESERTATEEQHLRLDSLVKVYEVNEAYLSGILNALTPPENIDSGQKMVKKAISLNADSLLKISAEERSFMENIRERDKYNIDYVSPAAAQSMMFGAVNKAAVITQNSKEKYKAEFILPVEGSISSIADGKVISVASSPGESGGYEVIIQHPKGFLSKSSRLTHLMVKPGDRVISGQIIANGSYNPGRKAYHMYLELWRDGDPLIPANYLKGGAFSMTRNEEESTALQYK